MVRGVLEHGFQFSVHCILVSSSGSRLIMVILSGYILVGGGRGRLLEIGGMIDYSIAPMPNRSLGFKTNIFILNTCICFIGDKIK